MIIFTSLIHTLDVWVLHGLYSLRTFENTLFFIGVSELGTVATITGVTAGLVLWLMTTERYARALALAATVGGTGLAVTALKYLFARPRPSEFFQAYPEIWHSFPSWHAAGTAALAVYISLVLVSALALRTRRIVQALAVSVALAVGFSRAFLGVHYASDVLAGWIIGGAFAYGAYYLLKRFGK